MLLRQENEVTAILQGKRIFYVEDNLQNRSLVQLLLERHGVIVGFERWGGQEALVRLGSFLPVDLILMDLMFPKNVTGYQVFEAIRRVPALASIPVAAISAADPATEMNKSRAAGFSGFIAKPISLSTFPRQIAALMLGQAVWAAE